MSNPNAAALFLRNNTPNAVVQEGWPRAALRAIRESFRKHPGKCPCCQGQPIPLFQTVSPEGTQGHLVWKPGSYPLLGCTECLVIWDDASGVVDAADVTFTEGMSRFQRKLALMDAATWF